jgi:hypothetical protein
VAEHEPAVADILARLTAAPAGPRTAELVEALAVARAWQDAVQRARIAVDLGLPRSQVYVGLARGFLRAGRPDRGLRIIVGLEDHEQRAPAAVHVHLQCLIELGRTAEARALGERWLILDPDDTTTRRLLGRVRPEPDGLRRTDPTSTIGRANRLVDAGHPVRALRVLRQVLLENPRDERVRSAIRRVTDVIREARGAARLEPSRRGRAGADDSAQG